mmetsp:Transcript_10095/g.25250  ORF Transcript_10095/g.25250 Transcript_10095/m.25250 type:complete len:216 (-) Transcript_10095:1982-2629(-)
MVSTTASWYTECPRMFSHMVGEMSALERPYGLRLSRSSVGDSVASASDANESMIRLTQSICTAVRGLSSSTHAPTNATTMATTLTVSWNCRNLPMESYTLRPHFTALTMLLKLSSMRMMSHASLATDVPAMPIANPTSAFFSAGASLVPSPVTATTGRSSTDLVSSSPVTRVYLSVGDERAMTRRLGQILSNSACLRLPLLSSTRARKSGPSMHV